MQWARKNNGFTIVELLVVVVVIAILAAITIASYNGIQTRAQEASVRSDMTNFIKKINLQKISSNDDLYPWPPASNDIKLNKALYLTNRNNWYYCPSVDRKSYALGVASVKTGNYVIYNDNVSVVTDVSEAITCGYVSRPNGASYGHNWNGTTSTWASWIGGQDVLEDT